MAGPVYFAWVDASETTFDPVAHKRYDETILDFEVEQQEGQAATLTMTIINPYQGLLAVGRKQWGWLSDEISGTLTARFFGQLIALPTSMTGKTIKIKFIAAPLDLQAQKTAVAATMQVAPYYDPIFIREDLRDDPDTVLEGYSALWHIDRTTLAVTASDILEGEDGTIDFLASDGFFNTLDVSIERPPKNTVNITASVTWTQSASGTIDFGSQNIVTYSGAKLISDWPKAGTQLQVGYAVQSAEAKDVYAVGTTQMGNYGFSWKNQEKTHSNGDWMSVNITQSWPLLRSADYYSQLIQETIQFGGVDVEAGTNTPSKTQTQTMLLPKWLVTTSLVLSYAAARPRTETINISLLADLQAVLTRPASPDSSPIDRLSRPGADVGLAIDGVIPIGDVSRRSYFPTTRGLQSVEYIIALARARLRYGARVAKATRGCPYLKAADLSCRMNGRFYDDRLGGGSAEGKITAYRFSGNVTRGRFDGSVTIGCAIGNGGTISDVAGTNTYISDSYIDSGYYYADGQIVAFPAGDVGYTPPMDAPDDDGLVFPLTRDQVTVSESVIGSAADQYDALAAGMPLVAAAATDATPGLLSGVPATIAQQIQAAAAGDVSLDNIFDGHDVYYSLELKPLTGSFAAVYTIATTDLLIPQMIDLAA